MSHFLKQLLNRLFFFFFKHSSWLNWLLLIIFDVVEWKTCLKLFIIAEEFNLVTWLQDPPTLLNIALNFCVYTPAAYRRMLGWWKAWNCSQRGKMGKFWSLNGNLRVVLIPDSCVICPACRSLKCKIIQIPRGFQNQLRGCLFSFLVLFFSRTCVKALQNCAFIL